MRVLIDTTYLLPAIGVSIRGLSRTAVRDLRSQGHTIVISNITIFELAAKGAKLAASHNLNDSKVNEGLRAIMYDPAIEQVEFTEGEVMSRALRVREEISDFIDCLIVSSAASEAEILLTEDQELQHLVSLEKTISKLKPVSPKFRASSVTRLL